MTSSISLQQEISLWICLWAFVVTFLTIAAIWPSRVAQSVKKNQSKTSDEEIIGHPDPQDDWDLKTKMIRPGLENLDFQSPPMLFLTSIGEDNGGTTTVTAHTPRYLDPAIRRDLNNGKMYALDGIVQRVSYPAMELKVLAQEEVWNFTIDSESQLWFDDKPAVARCFQPLDNVLIIFADGEEKHVIKAMYGWEKVQHA